LTDKIGPLAAAGGFFDGKKQPSTQKSVWDTCAFIRKEERSYG